MKFYKNINLLSYKQFLLQVAIDVGEKLEPDIKFEPNPATGNCLYDFFVQEDALLRN
jgi:hypothetical protein